MASPPESGETPPPSGRYRGEHYGNTRHWALYDGGKLLGVMLYKKGTESIRGELEARDAVIAEQAARIEQLTRTANTPAAPEARRFQDRVWPETEGQLGFFTSEEKAKFRRRSPRGRG